jgi:hypothetical protein
MASPGPVRGFSFLYTFFWSERGTARPADVSKALVFSFLDRGAAIFSPPAREPVHGQTRLFYAFQSQHIFFFPNPFFIWVSPSALRRRFIPRPSRFAASNARLSARLSLGGSVYPFTYCVFFCPLPRRLRVVTFWANVPPVHFFTTRLLFKELFFFLLGRMLILSAFRWLGSTVPGDAAAAVLRPGSPTAEPPPLPPRRAVRSC